MKIRTVTKKDTEQLHELMRQYYFGDRAGVLTKEVAEFDRPASDISHPEIIANALSDKKRITFVAEADDKLVGYVIGEVFPVPEKAMSKEGYVWDIFVSKEYRGIDIGRALLDKIEKTFRDLDCTHLGIEAFPGNQAAIDIYRHVGFAEHYVALKKALK